MVSVDREGSGSDPDTDALLAGASRGDPVATAQLFERHRERLKRMVAILESRSGIGLACADVGDGGTPRVHPSLGSFPVPASVEEGWEAADYPNGTLIMARRRCLRDVGLFDERYFAYGEEIDLGLRAKAAGWEVGVVRGARVRNPSMSTRVSVGPWG